MWHQATAKGEKKVLLATQTWRNSSDMPVSRSNPTFARPLSILAGSRRPLAGGGKGAPRGVRRWTSKESTGKIAQMTRQPICLTGSAGTPFPPPRWESSTKSGPRVLLDPFSPPQRTYLEGEHCTALLSFLVPSSGARRKMMRT